MITIPYTTALTTYIAYGLLFAFGRFERLLPQNLRLVLHQRPSISGVWSHCLRIAIESLSVKDSNASQDDILYEGPDFGSLDENCERAFHKYLEIGGIKPSTTNFLHEYMINKDSGGIPGLVKNPRNSLRSEHRFLFPLLRPSNFKVLCGSLMNWMNVPIKFRKVLG
ncbi:hypothetical protein Scep_027436 [Stephania cephalantha]|uniref:Uncharacterized protein n=1 Tax=Stephania cephalantha TaxID=152367 RepID=A0AAP0E837_9MAGN